MPVAAPVLVLNGVSSSGKTTLAKAMQSVWSAPLHHVQLDAFRDMEPPGYWSGWETMDEGRVDLMLRALCGAMYSAVREYSVHGQGVLLDAVLDKRTVRRLLVERLVDLPVYLIGVHCNHNELTRREAERGDREIGTAAKQSGWIHRSMPYDYQVDTTDQGPLDLAAEVASWFAAHPSPTAFVRLNAHVNPVPVHACSGRPYAPHRHKDKP